MTVRNNTVAADPDGAPASAAPFGSLIRPAAPECRGRIYDSIAETVGMTPLIRVRGLAAAAGVAADIAGKCEFFNPLDSVKDRVGLAMIEAAEGQGLIAPGHTTLIEPTSGNTGIALAFAAAAKGYRLVLVMPGGHSLERRKMLRLLGATIVLTPAHRGIRGAIRHAGELVRVTPGAYMLQQFRNPANPEAHRRGTAEEIWRDTGGRIDVLVAGVGTGGTLTGVADVLKARKPSLHVVAVEPEGSPVLSGGMPGPHKIQGLGPGFVPETLDTRLIDEVVRVPSHRAFETARQVARLDALPVGISSGAALAAALAVGKRPAFAGRLIVAILPSCAERYLSTELFDGLD